MDSIIKSITEKFESRAKFGKEKYGVDMDRKDLKFGQWVTHMKEELMDAIIYLEKLEKMSEGGGDEKNKGFLTWEEARDQAEDCWEYQEGVYQYKIEGEGYTVVEYGEVLVQGVDRVRWYAKGVYSYKIKGKGWTLIEGGEVLIDGADFVNWHAKGVYKYKMEGGDWVKVNKNKEFLTLEEVKERAGYYGYYYEYQEGVYMYTMKGESCTLIEDCKVLVQGVYDVWWYAKGVYKYETKDGKLVYINNNK